MADRYWVGGTAAWDGTAGSKWAETSGGAGGFSVPTTADDVFFDAASSGTCTISSGNTGAKSINCTGFTGTIAGSAAITVAGSITLDAGQTYTHTGEVSITGTGTLTTAGKTFSAVLINGSGITVTLGDALNISTRTLTLSNGSFSTSASNYNITAGSLNSNITNTRTLSLNASTITLSGSLFLFSTNLTFNAGTSQINFTGTSITMTGGGLSYYNVSFTSTTAGTRNIAVANTFNDLSVTGPASAGVVQLTFSAPQTINGTLSTTGTAGNRRVWFRGVTYGIAQTLTVNATPSLTDADFRDIYVVGTAAPISGTRIGNRGYSRGITFSTPKNVYWNLAGAQNWSADGWAPGSGGTPNTDNFPLPQDTAIFDNTGSVTGTITLNAALQFTGSVDMSARTTAMTLSFGSATTCYGSWINGSGTTLSGTQTLTFSGEGTKTITSAGKTFSTAIVVDAYAGTVELADAMTVAAGTFTRYITVTNGTFDTKNYNLTVDGFSSSNSNVRSIKLGSSTVTLNSGQGGSPINFSTSTNLTFDAGTSQLTCPGPVNVPFSGGSQIFYDVSFTSTGGSSVGTTSFTGINQFRNLSFTAPATDSFRIVVFNANQTITGTLTCAGASAVRRIFVRSDTLGTPRTLTVGTLSATDCDFRDITIAGTAAGSSPTRAGNCGGNSGITFPAPKTVYWNLSGAQNWSATAWAPSSGGSPDINNFPLAQDTAVFDEAGSVTGTITIEFPWNIGTFDASARTSAMTLTTSASSFVYDDWKFGTGVTSSSSSGVITFAGRGTSTITSNGVTFNCPVTIDCVTGTVQLGDALTISSDRSLVFTTGTFDAVSYNLTLFRVSTGTGTKTVKMGSGTWTMTGAFSTWDFGTAPTVFEKGTANILLSDTSTTARTFNGAGLSYNKLTIGGATGISTTTISGNNQFTELASTKTVAHTIALGTTTQTFGKWTVTGTVGNVVTLTGTGTGHILAGSCTSGIDYLAMGSIGFAATSPGEFYAGANSTGTAAAPVYRTDKPADSTRYWVGGTGNWSDTNRWSTGSGGGGGASVPRSHDDVVFDSSSNATGYTATVDQVTGGNRCKSLTIAGPASGNVTFAGSVTLFIHDDITFPATGMTRTYAGEIVLTSNQTGRTFTTNGVDLSSTITINGVDCEWSLGSALSSTTSGGVFRGYVFITNGTFDTNDYSLTTPGIFSQNNNSRTLDFGSSTVTQQQVAGVSGGAVTGSNFTFFRGTSTFITQETYVAPFNHFYNFTLLQNAQSGTSPTFSADLICENNFTHAGSSITSRFQLISNTLGVTRTITCASATINNTDIRDITIAGGAAPVSPTGVGDMGGNSGITFPASKTVYRVGTNTTWVGSSSWALNSGGSGSNDNFPLAQDTAVIDESTALTGTLALGGGFNIGTLDCSTRTTGITLNHNAVTVFYGSYILGSGVTVSGTSNQTFAGRGTQTFTSVGKTVTFPVIVDKVAGAFELGDAFITNRTVVGALTLTQGTFDANGFNVTISGASGSFTSNNSNNRTLAIGSGTWTIAGTNGWNAATSTNLTVTGTGVIKLTSASAKTFAGGGIAYTDITLDQGGTGNLTISGNNTFKDIINTSGGATSILLGTTTQRVAQWTGTGTSGNVLTITGTSATSPATLVLTGTTKPDVDFLTITGIRAYDLEDTWYAGANSTNNGSLGWYFEAAPTPPPPGTGTGEMFLLFM
jgi:hypothetical protein